MGTYSEVSAKSLLNTTSEALTKLEKNNLSDVKTDLYNMNNKTSSAAGYKIFEYLVEISTFKKIKGSIPALKDDLKKLKEAAELIEDYQTIEDDISELNTKLYSYDEEGNKIINSPISKQIKKKKEKLSELEQKINNKLSLNV